MDDNLQNKHTLKTIERQSPPTHVPFKVKITIQQNSTMWISIILIKKKTFDSM